VLLCSALPQFRLAQIFEKVSDLCDTMLRADDDADTGRCAQRSGRWMRSRMAAAQDSGCPGWMMRGGRTCGADSPLFPACMR